MKDTSFCYHGTTRDATHLAATCSCQAHLSGMPNFQHNCVPKTSRGEHVITILKLERRISAPKPAEDALFEFLGRVEAVVHIFCGRHCPHSKTILGALLILHLSPTIVQSQLGNGAVPELPSPTLPGFSRQVPVQARTQAFLTPYCSELCITALLDVNFPSFLPLQIPTLSLSSIPHLP